MEHQTRSLQATVFWPGERVVIDRRHLATVMEIEPNRNVLWAKLDIGGGWHRPKNVRHQRYVSLDLEAYQ